MKGFTKDGKFRPTGNKTKSSLKKSDVVRNKKSVEDAKNLKEEKERNQREEKAKEHNRMIEIQVDDFNSRMNPFGSSDVWTAIEKAEEIGMYGSDLADLVDDEAEQLEMKVGDMDVVAVVYEHELQMARNKISEVLDYDFLNDTEHGSAEISVAGNYMATSFDYSQEALDELQQKINGATGEQKDELEGDQITKVFLRDLDIDLDETENKPSP